MTRLSRLFLSGGHNAVPLSGWFLAGWSPGTALVFFWFENLALSITVAIRIAAHWRATRTRGHTQGFLRTFLLVSLGFTAVHGAGIAAALTALDQVTVSRADLESGLLWMAGTQVASLTFDLWRLGDWPFAEIRRRVDWVTSRVMVVHLSILAGMALLFVYDQPARFFAAFLVLKAMLDIGTLVPQWRPRQPPAWLSAAMNRVPDLSGRPRPALARREETFEEYWTRQVRDEEARHRRDEDVVSDA